MGNVKECLVFTPCRLYSFFEKSIYTTKGELVRTEPQLPSFQGQRCEDLREVLMKVHKTSICPNNKPPPSKKPPIPKKEDATYSPGVLVYNSINFFPRLWRS